MTKYWRVDDMIIHKIVEVEAAYVSIEKFMPGIDPAVLKDNLSWFIYDGLEAETNCVFLSYHSFVVVTPKFKVLVDSCIGNNKTCGIRATWHNKTDRRWMDEFEATGLKPEDIDYVLCSHLHVDHVGWNTQLKDGKWTPTFPNARYLMVDKEYELTRNLAETNLADTPSSKLLKDVFAESIAPIVEASQADFVSAAHVIDEYFRLIPTPGHTAGHVAVAAGRDWDRAVFTGDLIHSPIQARYPNIRTYVDEDPDQAAQTRRDFLERYVNTQTLVCTMHFPDPSVGHLNHWDDGFRLDYVKS